MLLKNKTPENFIRVNIIDALDQECAYIVGDTYENFINKTNSIPERRAQILISGLLSDDITIVEKAIRIYGSI